MAGLFGSPKVSNNAPVISSLRVQTSCYGKPIPLLYGMPRVAVNVIQYEDFQAHAHTERAAGGKGGGGAPSTTTYTYTATLLMALGSGPVRAVPRVWRGKEIHTPESIGLDVYLGDVEQAPFPHIATKFPDRAYSYPGIAYLASASYELGNNASLENHNAEVATLTRVSDVIPDADVHAVIYDLITNPITGLRMPESALDDLMPLWSFCRANGLFVSPAYTEQKPAKEMLQALIDIGFADAVYSENRLKIVPYSDMPAVGNGVSYEPSRAPVYELTEDDFVTDEAEPPVRLTRKHGSDVFNHVQVKFFDRANDYNEQVAEDKDAADIDARGLRTMPVVEAKEICVADVAARLANFKVRRAISVRNTYSFALSWKHVLLEATDIVLITLPGYGFDQVPVLITQIEEDEDGRLTFEAEDYPMNSTAAAQVPSPEPGGFIPDFSVEPGNANIPVMFEPPYALTDNRPELWLATAGGENWGGAEVWVSLDNASYKRVGRIEAPSRHGSLAAPLPAGAIIDTAHLLQVDMSASRGQLLAGTHADAESLVTLCYVGGEYLSYADATLTGVNGYSLGYLVRGAHGSDNAAHAAGSPFARLDGAPFRYAYPKEWLGKTIWVKLVSFNRYNSGIQALSEVPAFSHILEGAPLPAVTGFRFEQPWTGMEAKLAWEPQDGAAAYDVEIQAGVPVAPVRNANRLTSTRFVYSAADMFADGGPWRTVVFRVRARSTTGRTGPWAQLLATNPQIGPLTGIKVDAGVRTAYFSCERPEDGDFAGVMVWMGESANFITRPDSLVYDGPGTMATLSSLAGSAPLEGGKTYYVRAAGYDTFGKDGMSVSPSVAVDVVGLAPDRDSITSAMIKDGVLDVSKFAQGLSPVQLVDVLPNPAGYTGAQVVLLKTDGKLYRYRNGAWTAEVSTGDLNGLIGGSNLLPNASFEYSPDGLRPAGYFGYNNGNIPATYVRAAGVRPGTFAFGLRAGGASVDTFGLYASSGIDDGLGFSGVKGGWIAGRTYTLSFLARKLGPSTWGGMGIAWNTPPASAIEIQNQPLTGEYQRYVFRITWGSQVEGDGRLFLTKLTGVDAVAAGDEIHIDDVQVEEGDVATAFAPCVDELLPGTVGPTQITDQAITSPKIAAGAVTAGKIAAAAVTANELAAGSVVAGKLSADAVTAGTVAAGAIGAREIAAGSITAGKLAIGNFDNLVPDPDFNDLGWWSAAGITGYEKVATNWAGTPWNSDGGLKISRQSATPVAISSKPFSVELGAKYRVRIQVWLEVDFNGQFAAILHIPSVAYHAMGQTSVGTWSDGSGMPVFQDNSTQKGVLASYEAIVDNVATGSRGNTWMQLIIKSQLAAGSATIAGISVVRVSDATLIQDGAITTQKLTASAVTADKLAANSVTADKLVANSVTADKLAAAAVTASKIAAGSIAADHMMVGQSANMLTNPGFESGFFGWTQVTADGAVQWGLNLSPSYIVPGTSTKTVWSSQTGGAGTGTTNAVLTQNQPCEAGKTYMASVHTGAHRCVVYVLVEFLDANGTWIAPLNTYGDYQNQQEAAAAGGLSAYKRIFYRAKAPPGAARVSFTLVKVSTLAGQADSYMFATRPYLGEVLPNQTEMPAWDAAGATVIGPGNISTESLSAITANLGAITAGTLDLMGPGNFVRSNQKSWGDGKQGFISYGDGSASTYLDAVGGSSRLWMSSWGDCGISFPNFRVDNAGNVYVRGDIQANSLTANIVNTPHMVDRSVSDAVFASSVNSGDRLWFTLSYASLVVFGAGALSGSIVLRNSSDAILAMAGGLDTGATISATNAVYLAAGSYYITGYIAGGGTNVFALFFKR